MKLAGAHPALANRHEVWLIASTDLWLGEASLP